MGQAMAKKLLAAENDLLVYNRTRPKLAPLVRLGATAVDSLAELSHCDIVFVTVAGDEDFATVVDGPAGLAPDGAGPAIVIDHTTVSADVSAAVRQRLAAKGIALLAAPVSGNAKVIDAGLLSIVVSGPAAAFERSRPFLDQLARRVTYVGEGELARLVKICHNLYLAVVIQGLIEITVLAERAGISRSDMLAFINTSVMGSTFSSYKTPALVNLDFAPTFTTDLLLKDVTLALDAAEAHGVPLPAGSAVAEVVRAGVEHGLGDVDFAALIELEAHDAGLELVPENVPVPSGLEPPAPVSLPET
jgi:3-hydroxyisobutyrate dehydrogenase-like beta-hydroxyacid dehydrogenase